MLRTLVLVLLGLLLTCCTPAPTESLFPTAATVRIVGAPTADGLQVGPGGHVSADAVSPDLSRDVAVPVKDGGLLTPREMAALRAAVQFTRPPDMMLACCEPRHAFLFYDKSGRYLGFLMVCFECGCAVMEPFHPADEEHSWIAWNPEAVKAIVVAHQLAPLVPPRS